METKICPSCGIEVPLVAGQCKACFHDFRESDKPRRTGGPVLMLVAFAAAALVAVGAVYFRSIQPVDQRVHIDQDARTIHWITQYQTGAPTTDRISFDQIAKLEYATTSAGNYEIWAITIDGDRKLLAEDLNTPLRSTAERYAEMFGKPLTVTSDIPGASAAE